MATSGSALLVALVVFDHRSTPCHVQITRIPGTVGTVEQCVTGAAGNR
jgi:hypothetical protein